ncbi:MAG: 26S protease regulatory subunit [Halobacteriaceae archaeon]
MGQSNIDRHFARIIRIQDDGEAIVQIGEQNIEVTDGTDDQLEQGDVVEVWISTDQREIVNKVGFSASSEVGIVRKVLDEKAIIESNGLLKTALLPDAPNLNEGQTVEVENGIIQDDLADEPIVRRYGLNADQEERERAESYRVDPEEISTSYSDVGGLSDTIGEVREVIEIPLLEAEREENRFDRHGVEPDTGIMFYGPPGTGKTMLARSLANETESNFYLINGPEVINKWYGETENIIRDIFADAKENTRSIIFINEIDSIEPKRSDAKQFQSKIVAQLLTELDGFDPLSNVVVIGATNVLDEVDPALLRPGRFDRKIKFDEPNDTERLDILQKISSDIEFSEDVELQQIADSTEGMTGADLSGLIRQAVIISIKRDGELVTMEDLIRALDSTRVR